MHWFYFLLRTSVFLKVDMVQRDSKCNEFVIFCLAHLLLAFCTVTNDDFAYGNLLSHPSASFGIPTLYLLLFLLLTTSAPSCLFWFCISFTFLSHFFPTCSTLSLPLCLCSLSRQDFATHCEPRWERRLHQLPALDPCLLPLMCICPSCKMYLSVKPYLFVQIWCYKEIKKSYFLTVGLIFVLFWAMF